MEQNEQKRTRRRRRRRKISPWATAPFFLTLFALTVVAFIIPLRPTQSMEEKRTLAEFPAFSWEALTSGSYFDDISVWFSDTFPGREGWLRAAASVEELHGFQDVVVHGNLIQSDTIPTRPSGTAAPETEGTTAPSAAQQMTAPQDTGPVTEPSVAPPPTDPIEVWGGIDVGNEEAEIIFGNVLQINDAAFSYFGFSKYWSDYYIDLINGLADAVAEQGTVVVSAMAPSSIGVMVESEYMDMLGCADQGETIDYLLGGMNDRVVKVDMFQNLVDHNDQYLYFRTDHHWTGLGAYYGYVSICQALGMEPAPLSQFELKDQGEFQGSLYYQCNQSSRLRLDNVYAYEPPGDLETYITNENGSRFSWTVLTDMSHSSLTSKYMTFIAGDNPLTEITNNDLPDGPTCVVLKDSYANPVVPLLTQNYHKIYVVDFRSYTAMGLREFSRRYDVDHIIFCHSLGMSQAEGANSLFHYFCKN